MRLSILVAAACLCLGAGHARSGAEDAVEPGAISGRVLDAFSGEPILGAMVYIVEAKSRGAVPLNDSALTDAAGTYRFINLVPIEDKGFGYVLRVKTQRYVYTQTGLLNVAPGQELVQDFSLQRILSLSLAVRDSADKAVVLPGAKVTLVPPGWNSPIRTVETDSQGKVGFSGLGSGDAVLTIAMKGYLTLVTTRSLDGSDWEDTVRAALRKDSAGVNRSLQGTLKLPSGNTVSGYPFFFRCQALSGTAYLYAFSGTDGRFRFEGIPGECATGVYFRYPDSALVTLTGTGTQADFIVVDPLILPVKRPRAPLAKVSTWMRWFRDFNVLGRSRH